MGSYELCYGELITKTWRTSVLVIYLDLQKSPNNGPISQNRDYRQYRVRYFGHFGAPGTWQAPAYDAAMIMIGTLLRRNLALVYKYGCEVGYLDPQDAKHAINNYSSYR